MIQPAPTTCIVSKHIPPELAAYMRPRNGRGKVLFAGLPDGSNTARSTGLRATAAAGIARVFPIKSGRERK